VHGPTEIVQCRVAQPAVVAEQDQVDQPLALEHVDRVRMNVGPPVDLFEVAGYLQLAGRSPWRGWKYSVCDGRRRHGWGPLVLRLMRLLRQDPLDQVLHL